MEKKIEPTKNNEDETSLYRLKGTEAQEPLYESKLRHFVTNTTVACCTKIKDYSKIIQKIYFDLVVMTQRFLHCFNHKNILTHQWLEIDTK